MASAPAPKRPATTKATKPKARPTRSKPAPTAPAPPKRPAHRPTLCTPDVTARFLQAVRAGNFIEDAAVFAGIDRGTYYRWLEKAEDPRPEYQVYRDFRDTAIAARTESKVGHVLNLHNAGKKHWQASAWYLERSYPEQFGRRRLEVTGAEGGPIRVDVEGLEAEIEALIGGERKK